MTELIGKLEDIQKAFLELARKKTTAEIGGVSYVYYQISNVCGTAAEKLKREIPQEMEMEGGGSCWRYVCPECHGTIDRTDRWCRHCGQAVKA